MTYQEKLNAEFGRSKSAEEEKALLREQIVDLRKVNTHLVAYSSNQYLVVSTQHEFLAIHTIYLVAFDCTFY